MPASLEPLSAGRARTPSGQPPGRRRYVKQKPCFLSLMSQYEYGAGCFRAGRQSSRHRCGAGGDSALRAACGQLAVATSRTSTVDEYGVLFRNLFSMAGLESKGIHGIVISSVVPPLDPVLRQVCERYFSLRPLYIEPGIKTGMPGGCIDNPAEVGADRIVNAVAAFEKYGGPCVIVDFGTATTFDCVSAKGEYLGGA